MKNKIVGIMKDHFSPNKELKRELGLYKTIYETRDLEKNTAEKLLKEAKVEYSSLNKSTIFKEQSALINKINSCKSCDSRSSCI